jgi:hypothetical protein
MASSDSQYKTLGNCEFAVVVLFPLLFLSLLMEGPDEEKPMEPLSTFILDPISKDEESAGIEMLGIANRLLGEAILVIAAEVPSAGHRK